MNELTREQILLMPAGRELDKLIAVNIFEFIVDQPLHIMFENVNSDFKPVPLYSTDIAAAWEVVEKMRQEHKQYITIIDNPHLNYDVRFSGSKSKEYHRLSNLPYAICRASLLAVMGL